MAQHLQLESLIPNIGMDKNVLLENGAILANLLADELVLASNAANFRFNVIGQRAEQLSDLFKDQQLRAQELSDKVAIELRTEGARIPILPELVRMTRLPKPDTQWLDADTMVKRLLNDHELIVRALQNNYQTVEKLKDKEVADFLLVAIRAHKDLAKKLRVHIESERH